MMAPLSVRDCEIRTLEIQIEKKEAYLAGLKREPENYRCPDKDLETEKTSR